MLTKVDIENIQSLKKKGYSRRRTAAELGLNSKTVARYWGNPVLSYRLEDYFSWTRCIGCGTEYPRPKFLPSWECPGCRMPVSWNGCCYRSRRG